MYQLSPNIELIFTEAGDPVERVRAAAAAGFDAVEFWSTFDKDVPAIAAAAKDLGISVTSVLAEPRTSFNLPGADLNAFHDGLARGIENARLLGCPRIVLGSGIGFPGYKRPQNLAKLVDVFSEAVTRNAGSGVQMVLEPVNARVDHPGVLLDRTADAVSVVRAVDSPDLGILYDLYHSVVESEDPATELANAAGTVQYVQVADAPGRGEPGSGAIDWPAALAVLRASGYGGPIGLEFFPTVSSQDAVTLIRSAAADI